MPGVDIQKDILDACSAQISLPKSGQVQVVTPDFVSGEGFSLKWGV
jgi:acyl CoA:acetate/3-ketoacid CoA transferase